MRTKYIRIVDVTEVAGRKVVFDVRYKEGEIPKVIKFSITEAGDISLVGEYVIENKKVKIIDTSEMLVGELTELTKGIVEACGRLVREEADK